MNSQRDHNRVPKQASLGDTLGVLACLLAAVMLMSIGWFLPSANAQAQARGASGFTFPL